MTYLYYYVVLESYQKLLVRFVISSKRQTAYGQIQAAALDTRNAPATGITATGERLKTENQGIDPPWGKQVSCL